MSNGNHLSDLFQQLERTVQDISSLNVSELKNTINTTVRDVVNAAVSTVEDISNAVNSAVSSASSSQSSTSSQPEIRVQSTPKSNEKVSVHAPSNMWTSGKNNRLVIPKELAVRPKKVPGRVSGTFLSIAGVSGSIIAGIGALSVLGSAAMAAPLIALTAFAGLAGRGFFLTNRADRYARYYNEMRGITFCPIKELAEKVNKSSKFVVRDLKKMIQMQLFKEGHIDADGKTFILDHETYQHYLDSMKRQEAEKAEKAKRAKDPELQATIEEGMLCIQKIREANDAIPGVVISEKLDRLEMITRKIFEFMEKYPERLGEIRRFTSYYLPTTLKLVAAYREFDAQEIQGETVQESKKEIETALDTINHAFENMYDKLFEQNARDLSADISVLHTMLKQEGFEKDEITGAKPD